MTTYEPDPNGALVDGCWVRTAEQGGIEGTWQEYPSESSFALGYIASHGAGYIVPRGLEQHLIVLREVIDNRPTEPGRYEVTWEDGYASGCNPFTLTEDGRWIDRIGVEWTDEPKLRRASFVKIEPDNRPLRAGRYEVTWEHGLPSTNNPWTLTEDGRWLCGRGDEHTNDGSLRRAMFRRLPDRPAEPGYYAVEDSSSRRYLARLEQGTWYWRNTLSKLASHELEAVTAWYRVAEEPWSPT